MRFFRKFATILILAAVLTACVMPGIADFGDFSGDSDYGSDSSDWSSSYSSNRKHRSDSGSEPSTAIGMAIVIYSIVFIIFAVI